MYFGWAEVIMLKYLFTLTIVFGSIVHKNKKDIETIKQERLCEQQLSINF